jgi:hypothetical protein
VHAAAARRPRSIHRRRELEDEVRLAALGGQLRLGIVLAAAVARKGAPRAVLLPVHSVGRGGGALVLALLAVVVAAHALTTCVTASLTSSFLVSVQ